MGLVKLFFKKIEFIGAPSPPVPVAQKRMTS